MEWIYFDSMRMLCVMAMLLALGDHLENKRTYKGWLYLMFLAMSACYVMFGHVQHVQHIGTGQ